MVKKTKKKLVKKSVKKPSKKPAKKDNKNLITKDMTFLEILEKNPEAGEILFKNGMHCIGCAMAMDETLEQGAWAHGIDADKIVNEINKKTK
jgi:hybrid cluster-associated redox disulfide protein